MHSNDGLKAGAGASTTFCEFSQSLNGSTTYFTDRLSSHLKGLVVTQVRYRLFKQSRDSYQTTVFAVNNGRPYSFKSTVYRTVGKDDLVKFGGDQ